MMKLARTDRSRLTDFAYTADKGILAAILGLMICGLVVGVVASPAVATRIGLEPMHFIWRQLIFLSLALPIMFGIALQDAVAVKRLGIGLFGVALLMVLSLPFIGTEIKGATRWIPLGTFTLQPSEFLKPGYIILMAAMFSLVTEENRIKVTLAASAVTGFVVLLLISQPDIGQTSLICASFMIMLILSGAPRTWILGLVGVGTGLLVFVYAAFDHVRRRVETWLDPTQGDSYQIDLSLDAFARGGLIGQGLGEGRIKNRLPDAHTDFIFAATAEEFGMIACLIIMALFMVVVWRGFIQSMKTVDPFTQLATGGLVALFGMQAIVNMGVNMSVLPTKGMTLPLVSYGGSSMLALAITTGMILALTRKRAGARSLNLHHMKGALPA